ncbi:Metallo-peptidase family M12-domain-containing protein [Gongronella butleri]|nr:Metallo-peptidase family M12-domain-containing protein [Gongronella butleri]
MKVGTIKGLYFFCVLLATCYTPVASHSYDNIRRLRVEPLDEVRVDIAPRPDSFFQKRDISPNRQHVPGAHSIEHDDMLRLNVQAYGRTHHLHLVPNHDLIHPDAVVMSDNGQSPLHPHEFRVYRGYVVHPNFTDARWHEDKIGLWRDYNLNQENHGILGWARILIRTDVAHSESYPLFEGSFAVDNDLLQVKLLQEYRRVKRTDDADLAPQHHKRSDIHMVVYRDSDTMTVPVQKRDGSWIHDRSCGADQLSFNQPLNSQWVPPAPLQLDRRSVDALAPSHQYDAFNGMSSLSMMLTKRAPAGCPTTKKIAYMGVAADCTYQRYYQSDTATKTQIINDWNQASAVYERQLNVGLGLINITLMGSSCPSSPNPNTPWNQDCSTAYTISDRLSDFSKWRATLGNDGAGLWHLMTNCPTGAELGIAWLGVLCETSAQPQTQGGQTQYVSGTGVSSVVSDEWKVVAHEVGHGFGAQHDCTADTCAGGSAQSCCPLSSTQCDAGGTYIMNPVNNASAGEFSPCTINTVCSGLPKLDSCLQDPGTRRTTGLGMCGNGIKENGEDCDVGQNSTACCDATTCKFKPGARCEDKNDGCCQNCQIRSAGYVCRPSSGACDDQEVCDGNTGDCPADVHKTDGSDCGNGLQCASGQCTSRDLQCAARGTSMNITKACSGFTGAGSCQMTCANPQGFASCYQFTGNFLDGTTCGVGGTCKNGDCNLDNFGSNIGTWVNQHLYIVIPVAAVVGLLFLYCVARCCCYRRRGAYSNLQGDTYVVTTVPSGAPTPAYGQYATSTTPVPQQQHYYQQQQSNWVDPAVYNGPSPSFPPPSYTPSREAYEMHPTTHSPSPVPGTRRANEGVL